MYKSIIDKLLKSDEPSIRFKIRANLFGENPNSPSMVALQNEIKLSNRVQKLLLDRDTEGRLNPVSNPYHKWFGAHWVLVQLAEMCYPKGDSSLFPLREQVYNHWLCEKMQSLVECQSKAEVYRVNKKSGIPVMYGRARRCASQQGNALFSTLALGVADDRVKTLASLLLKWQWPDGGWNCDKNPNAKISSFNESLIPLRALVLYQQFERSEEVQIAITKSAEVFLIRKMFRRKTNGEVIRPEFLKLHYPHYWHYDILFGLKVMAECGFVKDSRCEEALSILESKELPHGGWPAEGKYYRVSEMMDADSEQNLDKIPWGSVSKKQMNEWVTADTLFVLYKAGRINI